MVRFFNVTMPMLFPLAQQTPAALRTLQKAYAEKWWPIIRELGDQGGVSRDFRYESGD
jgi:hypothetical protein